MYAGMAQSIEAKESDATADDRQALRIHVASGVIAAAAFLEATINEFFAAAYHNNLAGVARPLRVRVSTFWRDWLSRPGRASTLEKYQLALWCTESEQFRSGADPYQSADDLIFLRNYLVHFEPAFALLSGPTLSPASKSRRRLQNLEGQRFKRSPLATSAAVFPDEAMGYDCARWAADTALNFTDEFYKRVGVNPPYRFESG